MQARPVALVTGASRGIGYVTALRLAKDGYDIAAVARSRDGLDALGRAVRQCGGAAMTLMCDLRDRDAVEKIVPAVTHELGPISVLINNAGFGGPSEPLDRVSDETYDAVFNTNLRPLFQLCRTVLPGMKVAGRGCIVNIASILGEFGAPGSSTYTASKHAVIGYSRAIASEWGRAGVRCNALALGFIDTEMLDLKNMPIDRIAALQNLIPQGRFGRADEAAAMISFLCGPESDYINGSVITIDGGLTAGIGISGVPAV